MDTPMTLLSTLQRFAGADYNEALDLLAADIARLCGAALVYVTAVDREGEVHLRCKSGPASEYLSGEVPSCIDKWAMKLGEPVYLRRTAVDARVGPLAEVTSLQGSMYVAPLTIWGRTYGALGLVWSNEHALSHRDRALISTVAAAFAGHLAISLAVDSGSVFQRASHTFSAAIQLVTHHRQKRGSMSLLLDLGASLVDADYAVLLCLSGSTWIVHSARNLDPQTLSEVQSNFDDVAPSADAEHTSLKNNMLAVTRLPDAFGKPYLLVYGRRQVPFSSDELMLAGTVGELFALLVTEQSHAGATWAALGELTAYLALQSGNDRAWLEGAQLARDTARELLHDANDQELAGHLLGLVLLLTTTLGTSRISLQDAITWLRRHLPLFSLTERSMGLLHVVQVVVEYVLMLKQGDDAWVALRRLIALPGLDTPTVRALETVVHRQLVALVEGQAPSLPPSLTQREIEILKCLGLGWSNKRIAEELMISEKTVKVHVSRVLHKTGVGDRTQAALLALQMELVDSPTRPSH